MPNPCDIRLLGSCCGRPVEPADHRLLMAAEIWVPNIENENGAVLFAAVPGFVLDRVVESESLALDPASRLAANAKLATFRNDEWQVNDATHIGDPGVRRDMASCLEDGKEDVRSSAVDAADRKRFHEGCGFRGSGTGFVETLPLLP